MLKKMCKTCGAEVPAIAKFCRECGTVVPPDVPSMPRPEEQIASVAPLKETQGITSDQSGMGNPSSIASATSNHSTASAPPTNPVQPKPLVQEVAQPVHQVVQQMPFGTVTVSVTAPPPPPVYVPPTPADQFPSENQPNHAAKDAPKFQADSSQEPIGSKKSQVGPMGYILGFAAVALLVGGGAYWYAGGSGESIKVPQSTIASSREKGEVASINIEARKTALNELVSAAFDGKWQDVTSKAALIKSLVRPSVGNRVDSEKFFIEANGESQDPKKIEQLLRKSIDLDPSFARAKFYLANILVDSKKLKEASDVLTDALILEPTSSYGWGIAADIFAQTDRDAVSAMRLALFFQIPGDTLNLWESREAAFIWIRGGVDADQSVSEELRSLVASNRKLLLSTPAYKP